MSKKSGKSSKRAKSRSGEFSRTVWSKASDVVAEYRLILEPDERLGYIGSSIEIPTVFADGPTPDTCVTATRTALTVAVATMLERGARAPAARARRSVQVNIRLTPDEKLALDENAARLGYKGISDFIRNAALERTGSSKS